MSLSGRLTLSSNRWKQGIGCSHAEYLAAVEMRLAGMRAMYRMSIRRFQPNWAEMGCCTPRAERIWTPYSRAPVTTGGRSRGYVPVSASEANGANWDRNAKPEPAGLSNQTQRSPPLPGTGNVPHK